MKPGDAPPLTSGAQGVGASVPRKEDLRFMTGRGQFVGDTASDKTEELLARDLDFDLIEAVRQQWAFYRDRRPDAYEGLVQP